MDISAVYDEWSPSYDRDPNKTRDLDQIVTRQELSAIDGMTILEFGCGTGKNTRFLSQYAGLVLALDASPGMLTCARRRISDSQVSFSRADITRPWPCAPASVDLVTCNLILEHIKDLDFVFREASRTLRASGIFFVCELHPFRQYRGSRANFRRSRRKIEIPAYIHHISEFFSAARASNLVLDNLREWWHADDQHKPPRLVSFKFTKTGK